MEEAEGGPLPPEQLSAAVLGTAAGGNRVGHGGAGQLGCASRSHRCRSAVVASEQWQQLLLQAASLQHQPLMAEQAQPQDHRVDVALPLPALFEVLA